MKTLRIPKRGTEVTAKFFPWCRLNVIEVPEQSVDFAGVRIYWDDSAGVRIYRYLSPMYVLSFRIYKMLGDGKSYDVDFYSVDSDTHVLMSGEPSDLKTKLTEYFTGAGAVVEEMA